MRGPRLSLTNGTLEALKWLGLLLMTGDHVNKYLFNHAAGGAYCDAADRQLPRPQHQVPANIDVITPVRSENPIRTAREVK